MTASYLIQLCKRHISTIKKGFTKFYINFTYTNRNLAVQEEVEARTNISFNDLWTVKVVLPGEYCYIFNAPEKIRPSLIIGVGC